MAIAKPSPLSFLRTLLVLGRSSNLPTVWSNCLAGWLLSGGGELKTFLWLCAGATCLYTGGMYLNDAIDANFDLQFRRERLGIGKRCFARHHLRQQTAADGTERQTVMLMAEIEPKSGMAGRPADHRQHVR